MNFAQPDFLFLLILIPIFFYFWLRKEAPPQIHLSLFLVPGEKTKIRSHLISTFLKSLALALCIVALARPQSISRSQERSAQGIDIVMLLDISLSMLIQDMGDQSRMSLAKDVFSDFIQGRESDRIGFVIFSGEPLTLAPPTLDYGLLLSQLKTVEPGAHDLRDGTAIGDGLALSINRLKKSKAKSRVIILLTDGDNNVGRIDPRTAGELALGYNIKVYSIAIGTEGRVRQPLPMQTASGIVYRYAWVENRLNPGLLKSISENTKAKFYRVTDEQALQEVFKDIDSLEKTEVTSREKIRYDEDYWDWALAALLVLLIERALSTWVWRRWA